MTAVGAVFLVWTTCLILAVTLMPRGHGTLRSTTASLSVMIGVLLVSVLWMLRARRRLGRGASTVYFLLRGWFVVVVGLDWAEWRGGP